MPFQHGSQRQRGEHMDADNVVIAAAADELIEPLRAGGQIAIDSSALPKNGGSVFHAAVACTIQLRRVPVNAGVPVADKARRPLGDELQRVNDSAWIALAQELCPSPVLQLSISVCILAFPFLFSAL